MQSQDSSTLPTNAPRRGLAAASRARTSVRIGASIALFAPLVVAPFLGGSTRASAAPAPITGVIFDDRNGDGTQSGSEPGIGGVAIAVYDAAGASVGSATSSTTATVGSFSVSGTDTTAQYRVEVTKPAGWEKAPKGVALTSFANGGAAVNIGLFDPSAWCQSNPAVATSCFRSGDSLNPALAAVPNVISLSSSASGVSPLTTVRAAQPDVGSVWGLAHRPSTGTIYAAALVKRHAGLLSPGGAGAVYALPTSGSPTLLATIPNVAFSASNATRGLTDLSTTSLDDEAYAAVGKEGLGGMDISGDESTLFVLNLADRSIYPVLTSTGAVQSPIAVPVGSCPNGSARPFALTWRAGKIYVGVVCDAASGVAADLRARVEVYDGSAWSTAIVASLNYTKGCAVTFSPAPDSCRWHPWSDTLATFASDAYSEPQPLLSSIAFDASGAMILGFRDRNSDRFGQSNLSPTTLGTATSVTYFSGGDILRATPSGAGSFTLESNGSDTINTTAGAGNGQGPGAGPSGEFYFQESFPGVHEETATGAVAAVGGGVLATTYDPNDGSRTTFTGGIETFSNTTGAQTNGVRLTSNADAGTFGKAAGLGDLELLCDAATIEIGDRVWVDGDNDGVQDPGEAPLAGVSVELRSGATVLDTAVTDSLGDYLFSNAANTSTSSRRYNVSTLTANGSFTIVVPMTQSAITTPGYVLATANASSVPAGGADERDSDAALNGGGNAQITVTTGAPGQNNHSYDFGFKTPPPVLTYCIGNRVWIDTDDSGTVNNGEVGRDGIVVTLTNQTTSAISTDTTADGGYYEFCGLSADNYRVSFTAPDGYRSSTTNINGETNASDNDDNGTQSGPVIQSNVITLGGPSEPTGEPSTPGSSDATADNQSNLTIDFGLVPTHCFGNRIWRDADDSGTVNNGETGYDGIVVTLLNSADVSQGTATTANGGYYQFCGLDAGAYRAQFTPPSGYRSSTLDADPETVATDNDDNGSVNATVIQSVLVTLGGSPEPTGEPTTPGYTDTTDDNRSNLTVDFGLYQLPTIASLGDRVWEDLNSNGVQDGGEPGVDGVAVELLDSAGSPFSIPRTTVTTGGGIYAFTGLTPGTYAVRFTLPSGATFTTADDVGAGDANDSDAGIITATTGTTGFYTLVGGENNITVDAGIIQPVLTYCIGNRIWIDTDDSGTINNGELGIDGIVVQIVNATTSVTAGSDTTADGGYYELCGLAAGNYTVRFTTPSGYTSSTATFDAESVATDNDDNGSESGGSIISGIVVLGGSAEPTGEPATPGTAGSTPDNRSNLTVDFGLVLVPAATTSTTTPDTTTTTPDTTTTVPDATTSTTTTIPGETTTTTTPPLVTLPPIIVPPASTTTVAPTTLPPTTVAPVTVASTTTVAPTTTTTPCVSIGDDVYSDRNRNGVRDANERGISNATVTVTLADGSTLTAATDANGKYAISCIPPGTVSVTVSGVDPRAKATTPTTLSPFDLAVSRLDADFGFDMASVLGFDVSAEEPEVAPALAYTGTETNSQLQMVSWMLSLGGFVTLVATRRRPQRARAKARS